MADFEKYIPGSFLNGVSFEPIGTWSPTETTIPAGITVSAGIIDVEKFKQLWKDQYKGFHHGGIISPSVFSGINAGPSRFAEIPCLYCNEQISIWVQNIWGHNPPCWAVNCSKCKQRFMVHLQTCHSECERRLDCLGVGIFVNLERYPIIDSSLLRTPESPNLIMRPDQININVSYSIPTDLVILTYGTNKSESNSTVQNDWFKGDPFQLPNVLKR